MCICKDIYVLCIYVAIVSPYLSGRGVTNPTVEGFDSRRTSEKEPVGTSALMLSSGKNLISGRADTILQVGEISAVKESCSRL